VEAPAPQVPTPPIRSARNAGAVAQAAEKPAVGVPRTVADIRPGTPAATQVPAFGEAVARSAGITDRADPPAVPRAPVPAAVQVAEQVVRVVHAGRSQLRIDLSPAELGRVRVEAEFGDGRVTLVIQADRPETLDMLRADVRALERALGDAGLKLDPASVQFSLRGDDQQRGFAAAGGNAREGGGREGGADGGAGDGQAPDASERLGLPVDGVVDVMV
jgi:flagellar hook-length control protein FliK